MNCQPVITAEQEEALTLVKRIVSCTIDPERITFGDTKSYFPVMVDGNSRKTICRFYFSHTKYIGTISDRKVEVRNKISNADDISRFSGDILAVVKKYLD
ncbi:MAG TPA: hypothetical protein VGB50_06080 [Flavobacterium sp.]|jgi:hypothetical protein